MTNTTDSRNGAAASGNLSSMRLAELQALASGLGVKGTSRMRKSDLQDAIRAARGQGARTAGAPVAAATAVAPTVRSDAPAQSPADQGSGQPSGDARAPRAEGEAPRRSRRATRSAGSSEGDAAPQQRQGVRLVLAEHLERDPVRDAAVGTDPGAISRSDSKPRDAGLRGGRGGGR